MCTGSDSGLDPKSEENPNGWDRARGAVLKTLVLIGGALLVRRLTKSTTRWDHAGIVAQSLSGEKVISSNALSCFHLFSASSDSQLLFLNSQFSKQQAARDPDSYFNLRWLSCPAADMVDGSKVLYLSRHSGGHLISLSGRGHLVYLSASIPGQLERANARKGKTQTELRCRFDHGSGFMGMGWVIRNDEGRL
nr:chromophore lyase CRL, chloroplastic [Ipomoea batatas]